jgi:phytanoyl-CoA hydroxylase
VSRCRALLGHPFILKSVEKIQGRNFIPTWDSVVFKNAGAGAAIKWHRDDDSPATHQSDVPIFNVDFYLDAADLTNCVWGILGSNRWTSGEAQRKVAELNEGEGFKTDESCVPLPMNPGDMLFHNIHALHGSPAAQSALRRVIYYEFRPIEVELAHGPHNAQYVPLKQRVLIQCLKDRSSAGYALNQTPFEYRPDAKYAPPAAAGPLETYRYPHERYWRSK